MSAPAFTAADWQSRIVRLEKVDPRKLLAHEFNFRSHPKDQREAMERTLREVGFSSPILVQDGTDRILDGHLRTELAVQYGVELIDALYLDLTDDEANALLTVFDKITGMATISKSKLNELVGTLPDRDAVRDMLASVNIAWTLGRQEFKLDDDAIDPTNLENFLRPETLTTIGDIWTLGPKHRLAVGDARDRDLMRAAADGMRHDMCWTDPPYGVSYVGKTKESLTIENDNNPLKLRSLLDTVFSNVEYILVEGAPVYIAHPAGALSMIFGQAVLDAGWRWHQTLIWEKDMFVLGHSDYHYQHEPIILAYTQGGEGRRGRGGPNWFGTDSETSVFSVPRPRASRDHPTMKPMALVADMIRNSCPPGGRVLDPFGGSGQTLMAAESLGIGCTMLELDPTYADVIIRRWEQFHGVEAKKERNIYEHGEIFDPYAQEEGWE